jgi:hypothetical protein
MWLHLQDIFLCSLAVKSIEVGPFSNTKEKDHPNRNLYITNHAKQENSICFEPENIHVSSQPIHSNQQTIKNVHPWFFFHVFVIS